MIFREAIAAPMLAALALRRSLAGDDPHHNAFRILIFHGIPPTDETAFIRLLNQIGASDGFLTPEEAQSCLAGRPSPNDAKTPYLLSFDDGFASNHDFARAVLAERGIKGVFFVCPGLVDLDPDAQRELVTRNIYCDLPISAKESLMTWDHLGALSGDGHVIGAHSMTHSRLAALDSEHMVDEVGRDADRIAELLGKRPQWFAYPFGTINSINESAMGAIAQHFKFCRSGLRGKNMADTHPLALGADYVNLSGGPNWQRLVLTGGLDFRYRQSREHLTSMAKSAEHGAT